MACGCLVVFDMEKRSIVYQDMIDISVSIPYHAGFLSYREMGVYRLLMNKLRHEHPDLVPQILLVDGQGRLHPRHFGSACCVGLEFGIPTIGVGKNPFCGSEFIREKKEIGGNADKSTGKDENQKSNKEIQNLKEGEVDVCWDTREFKSHLRPCDVCLLSDLDP